MKDDFTLEDILEEERQKREARAGGQPTEEAPVIEYVPEEPGEEYVPEEQGYEPEEYAPDPGDRKSVV